MSFGNIYVYIVKILAKVQNTPQVKEAKRKEVETLMNYDIFEKVDDLDKKGLG